MSRSCVSALFAVLALALLVAPGCNKYTCDQACDQYYGTAENFDGYDQCRKTSLQPTRSDTPAQASARCVQTCEEALYTTSGGDSGTDDGRGNNNLQTEQDALNFIECVVERDYSPELNATTCDNLGLSFCEWFIW
jgi:hypothetical protein